MPWVWQHANWPHFTWDGANLAAPSLTHGVRNGYYQQLEQLSAGGLDMTPWLHGFLTQYAAAVRASVTTVQHIVYRVRF